MGGLSESAVILVVVAIGVGETLHRSPRNAVFELSDARFSQSCFSLLFASSVFYLVQNVNDLIRSLRVGLGARHRISSTARGRTAKDLENNI